MTYIDPSLQFSSQPFALFSYRLPPKEKKDGLRNRNALDNDSADDFPEVVRLFQETYPELPPISQGTVSNKRSSFGNVNMYGS
ncbi:hypothetical protein NQ318_021243 [Aromia moschata]|uniref:Uncharacterized protein n=1 Tax=Aromia moschata TaxID=1265417 RepID=A0AAV8X919_9CUCU|nr:hypothetical protein NQ318_021243 [Aromia moschata]